MTDKQKHLYVLYKEVDELCRKHNIDYQLAGGTLIGAIRHRGFIPWDDDMDITMTRNNWDKFVEVCKTELPDDRILECQELNHNFHNVIARYTDRTSSAVHSTQVLFDDVAGDMIDIICYDYLPDNNKSWKQYTKDITLYSDLINPCIVYSYRFGYNRFRYGFYRLKMRFQGKDKVLDNLQKKMFSYKEEDCPYVVLRWGGTQLLFRKEIFGDSKNRVLFEDTMGQAPDYISDYLVEHYEDEWMFVPPATEQAGHNAIFSLDTDYKVIRNEIKHFVDPEKQMKTFLRKKAFVMPFMSLWLVVKDFNTLVSLKSKAKSFRDEYNNCKADINRAYENNNFATLEEIFSDYIALQFHKDYFGRDNYNDVYKYRHPVLLKLPDEIADKIVLTLFNRNNISKAMRYITVTEQKKAVTPYMLKLKRDILFFREAVHNTSIGKLVDAEEQSEYLYKKYPYSIGVIKLRIYILMKLGMQENFHSLNRLVNQGLKIYPDDGDLLKYQLDLECGGKSEKLVNSYIDAYHNTLNGFTQLDIQDIVTENIPNINTIFDAEKALSVLPENVELINKFVDLVIKEGKNDKVYSLFAFLKDKIRFLGDKYQSTVNKVTSFFIAVEKENKLFLNSLLCEDYDELLKLEEKVNKLQDSSVKDLILGDILYKKGESEKAIESYIKATENTDNDKTLCILKYRFFADLEKLDSYLEQVNFLRKLNIETRKEEEASEERKATMRKNMFEQWKAPYKDSKTISKIYSKVSLIDKMFVGEEIDLTTMIDIIEEVGAYADPEVKTTPIVLGHNFKNTVDGPQHTDHNLVAPGDSNV